jgi:prefoldin beta subunit
MVDISKEAQELLMKVQSENQQLQSIMVQRQNVEMQEAEIRDALAEIEGKDEIYKSVAGLLIKADRAKVKEELEESIEFMKLKKKQFSEQENHLKKSLEDGQRKLMGMLQAKGGAAGMAE